MSQYDRTWLECTVCGERLHLRRDLWFRRAGKIGDSSENPETPRELRAFLDTHGEFTCKRRRVRPDVIPPPGKLFRVVLDSDTPPPLTLRH